jgi:hypothetical protein
LTSRLSDVEIMIIDQAHLDLVAKPCPLELLHTTCPSDVLYGASKLFSSCLYKIYTNIPNPDQWYSPAVRRERLKVS